MKVPGATVRGATVRGATVRGATVLLVVATLVVEAELPPSLTASADHRSLDERGQVRLSAQGRGRLFPPQDLGLLESPDRAAWQKPDQIMDALRIFDGSVVADIGAGSGWFTMRLAQRVGPKGTVYAQDVQREMLEVIRRRAKLEGLQNVVMRRGEGSDPNLPANSIDAVLVVDTYYQVDPRERVAFLKNLATALKPGGRIGIVNYKPGRGGPGPDPEDRLPSDVVEQDARAAGLRVLARENLPYQYLIVLGR